MNVAGDWRVSLMSRWLAGGGRAAFSLRELAVASVEFAGVDGNCR